MYLPYKFTPYIYFIKTQKNCPYCNSKNTIFLN